MIAPIIKLANTSLSISTKALLTAQIPANINMDININIQEKD